MPACGRLEVWYAAIPIESIIERVERARDRAYLSISMEEARSRDHMRALGKLTSRVPGGGWLIRDRPPLLLRLPDDDPGRAAVPVLYAAYLRSLAPDRRVLVEKHRLLDVALKVVGVGSVGTRCYVALFAGPAGGPLILQVKEAGRSVLAPYVRGRRHRHQGERVVSGQRIMQAVSDSFLGWTKSPVTGTEYYVRQLHDMKYGIDIGGLRPAGMRLYAEVCAWALARAHARSGNPAEIAGYLWPGEIFERRSPPSRTGTPTRPCRITPRSSPRSAPGGSPGRPASEQVRATVQLGPQPGVGSSASPCRDSHLGSRAIGMAPDNPQTARRRCSCTASWSSAVVSSTAARSTRRRRPPTTLTAGPCPPPSTWT